LYKISSTVIGLCVDSQVDNGELQHDQKKGILNSLGKIMLPLIDTLGDMKSDL
jgi:hypothetical protein